MNCTPKTNPERRQASCTRCGKRYAKSELYAGLCEPCDDYELTYEEQLERYAEDLGEMYDAEGVDLATSMRLVRRRMVSEGRL